MRRVTLAMFGLALCLGVVGCPPADDGTPSEVAAPAFSPSAGRFSTPQIVTITCSTEDATIHYTMDGSNPSPTHGSVYSEPIHLEASTTLRAIASMNGATSLISSAEYVRQYLLSVAVDGSGSVTPEPGLYDEGTQMHLQASPASGWHFDHWEGHATGTQAATVLSVDSDLSVKACFHTDDPDLVFIDGLIVGDGGISISPLGLPVGTGYLYALGTSVHLTAVEHAGSVFVGWYTEAGLLVSTEYEIDLILTADTYVVAFFQTLVPPVLPVPVNCILAAQNGQYLGVITTNAFAADSLANPYGTYGSKYGLYSIWNPYGTYGSAYATYSPYNPYTSMPPMIFQGDVFIAYLTKNTFWTPWIDPDVLAIALGRYDAVRN